MSIVKTYFGAGGAILPDGEAPKAATTNERLVKGAYCWVDLAEPTDADFLWLEHTYNFHPLTIEDCRHFDQRAKVEEYDTYLFITMAVPQHLPVYADVEADELHAYLGADYLVTVHNRVLDGVAKVKQRLTADKGKLKTSPDFLLYTLADQLVDRYFEILDDMETEIERLEDEIIVEPDRDTLSHIFQLKQRLVTMRKTAGPERELFHALSGRRFPQISSRAEFYYRDLYDHIVRIYESIETSRELLSNALDAYLSSVSNHLSEVMKRLTVVATIFMPLSFIVGFGGMNFEQIPFGNPLAFAALLLVMCSTPALMMFYFWRRRYM